MHLQQSKVGKTGGPQYWLQNAPDHILEHILRHKKCQVILQTPYGPVETPFNAVDPDHKIVEVEKVAFLGGLEGSTVHVPLQWLIVALCR